MYTVKNAILSEKLDANMMEKFSYLPKLMGMKVIEQSGGAIIDTNIPCDMFNIVYGPKSVLDVKSVCDHGVYTSISLLLPLF